MTDPTRPLYYANTGKPLEYLGPEPVVRHRVRLPNGIEVLMTQEEFEQKCTNVRPNYSFDVMLCAGFLRVIGGDRALHFKIRRKFGDFPGQSVSFEEVRKLYENLGRWLADRDLRNYYAAPQPVGITATEARIRAEMGCTTAAEAMAGAGPPPRWPEGTL